jgi:uncharacterized membrane protein YgcG
MRIVLTLLTVAMLAAPPALAADPDPAATAKPKIVKKADMSDAQRRELEERIEALEHKHEMGYRETPGAPADAPIAPGLIDDE